jgi:hypothetical protein
MLFNTQLRRRFLANIVLLLILWGYVSPAALGATEANMPVCCRGSGKHHCVMAGMVNRSGSATPIFRANSPRCPYLLMGSLLNRSSVAEAAKSFSLAISAKKFILLMDSHLYVSGDLIRASGRSPPRLLSLGLT